MLRRISARIRAADTHQPSPSIQIALLVGLLLLMPAATPRPVVLGYVLLLGGLLIVSLRERVGLATIVLLLCAGIHLRTELLGVGYSDVLDVTRLAIDQVLGGGNPYGIGYPISVPPGAPFAYGPVALVWYMFADPQHLELFVSFVILGLLALRGRPLGLAIYALAPTLLLTAGDGSNDTSAGLLLLVALLTMKRSPIAGGLLLAVAIGFKPYAAAWIPPLVAWAGLGPLAAVLGASLAIWLPALLAWGPGPILESFRLAEAIHRHSGFSLAALFETRTAPVSSELFGLVRLVLGALAALVAMLTVRSSRGVILAGCAIYVVTLFTGYWSTYAYLSAIAPILCWHLDDWMGLSGRRISWPGDPWGLLSSVVERRWPARTT